MDEAMYTQAEKDAAVAQAVGQAEEEAQIVQMETDDLRKQLAAEQEQNAQLTAVMEEYSAEIARLMKAKASDSGESAKIAALELERAQVQEDLEKTETAFADLHSKYHKVKEVVENYKSNEKILKQAVTKSQEAHTAAEDRFNALRAHAEGKISEANTEIAGVREQYQAQIVALQAKVKNCEREIGSLKRQIANKDTDNEELTNICDELVSKLEQLGQPSA